MQPQWTGLFVTGILFGFAISRMLAVESNMEAETDVSEESIIKSQSMCAGEQEYVHKRKKIVLASLNGLGVNCTEDSVPNIALLGSGGGQRAAVGLMGSLYQIEKEGLLDSMLYLGGVSGSTWTMSFLYDDPEWSKVMNMTMSRLVDSEVDPDEVLSWLGKRATEEDFSLTDIWGALTSAGIMKQMDLRNLSEEANRNATNPYPVYSAIEKFFFTEGPVEGKWFEMTPHEAGFTELGFFIDTSLLGSKFQNGELVKRIPEMDMVQLQGILGSALASEGQIVEYIEHWLHVPRVVDATHKLYLHTYTAVHKVISMVRGIFSHPSALSDLDELQKLITDTDKAHQEEHPSHESKSTEEKQNVFQTWSLKLVSVVENWCKTLPDGPLKTTFTFINERVLPLIVKWEWGTTNNYLYKYENSSIPESLKSMKNIHLMDAGLLMNVPYPSFLGDKRDIDLFIAPDFSAGEMFETLTLARDYAAQLKKPFPEIDEKTAEEKAYPEDFYVFQGKEKEPTIVYLPLFNNRNCKDAEEVKERMAKFSTFHGPYSKEDTNTLLKAAKANIENNKENLLREINKAALRRQNREE
ncbi:cytosolic phospholipase A2 gamma-like [Notolabrus celidotus]|uniref:cytosolic phospholipase A2 gamma-like n=1 Tax=Notolabrus celidotus TaxID=1203425 RepID=UPI00149070AE|nr:cytosolic phospholipase A2 gamma-like [Notolabrus celidotus]